VSTFVPRFSNMSRFFFEIDSTSCSSPCAADWLAAADCCPTGRRSDGQARTRQRYRKNHPRRIIQFRQASKAPAPLMEGKGHSVPVVAPSNQWFGGGPCGISLESLKPCVTGLICAEQTGNAMAFPFHLSARAPLCGIGMIRAGNDFCDIFAVFRAPSERRPRCSSLAVQPSPLHKVMLQLVESHSKNTGSFLENRVRKWTHTST